MRNEAVSLGRLARAAGVGGSVIVGVSAPPWLRSVNEELPCLQDPELFFPYSYNQSCQAQIAQAKEVCLGCPVRDLCLQDAVSCPDLQGIWAATTPMERRRLRAQARKQREGTAA